MAQFIKADDGRYINVDHIWELIPSRFGGGYYTAHYPGTDENGDLASTEISSVEVRKLVARKPAAKTAAG